MPSSSIKVCRARTISPSPCLSFPGVRQSFKYGRLDSLENSSLAVSSHVLHKVMTRAPSSEREYVPSSPPIRFVRAGEERQRGEGGEG